MGACGTGIAALRTGIAALRTGIAALRTGIVALRTGIVACSSGFVGDRHQHRYACGIGTVACAECTGTCGTGAGARRMRRTT